MVIAVCDPIIEANTARFRIGPNGAERLTDDHAVPDASLDVGTLAAAYLGGTPWSDLALAGRITEHRRGAAENLDGLFRTARAPWCGTPF